MMCLIRVSGSLITLSFWSGFCPRCFSNSSVRSCAWDESGLSATLISGSSFASLLWSASFASALVASRLTSSSTLVASESPAELICLSISLCNRITVYPSVLEMSVLFYFPAAVHIQLASFCPPHWAKYTFVELCPTTSTNPDTKMQPLPSFWPLRTSSLPGRRTFSMTLGHLQKYSYKLKANNQIKMENRWINKETDKCSMFGCDQCKSRRCCYDFKTSDAVHIFSSLDNASYRSIFQSIKIITELHVINAVASMIKTTFIEVATGRGEP